MSFCLSSNLNPSPSTSLSSAFTARPLTTTGWSGWKEGRGEKEREEGRETEEEEGEGKGGKRGWRVGGGWKKDGRRMEEGSVDRRIGKRE